MVRPLTPSLGLGLLALLASTTLGAGCSSCDKSGDNAVDAAPSTSATPASSSAAARAPPPPPAPPPAAVAASDAAAPDGGGAGEGRRWTRRAGPSTMFFQSARELTLTPEQVAKVDAAEKLATPPSDTAAKDAAK